MELNESTNNIYVGYAYHNEYIWTIEFVLDNPPENYNMIYVVSKFKLKSIEDKNGKFHRKIPAYSINSEYFLRKHPLSVYFKRENLDFVDFYNSYRDKYEAFTGQVNEYFKHGIPSLKYYLINGELNGIFISYYYKYGICEESYFINGLRHGKAFFHDYNGYDIECEFNNGVIVSCKVDIRQSIINDIFENWDFINYNPHIIHIDDDYYFGTIKIENNKPISNTIIVKENKIKSLIEKNFTKIPRAIIDRNFYKILDYWYA